MWITFVYEALNRVARNVDKSMKRRGLWKSPVYPHVSQPQTASLLPALYVYNHMKKKVKIKFSTDEWRPYYYYYYLIHNIFIMILYTLKHRLKDP